MKFHGRRNHPSRRKSNETLYYISRRDELIMHIGMEENTFCILNNMASMKNHLKEQYEDEENKNEQTTKFQHE